MKLIKLFKSLILLLLSSFLLLSGCSKDDDPAPEEKAESELYKDALTTAKASDLLGFWSIYSIQYKDQTADVPVNFEMCGRDFFNYAEGGIYEEYVYFDTSCATQMSTSKWQLQNGVIEVQDGSGSAADFVITKLDATSFSFKARVVDVDDDGILDVVTLNAKKYSRRDFDSYTSTFQREIEGHESEIHFTWQPYEGINTFKNYEIYRNAGDCDSAAAEKIATITDVNNAFFNDPNPPVSEELCYFLRINTDKGLLGESNGYSLFTESLEVQQVALARPTFSNGEIALEWEAYSGPFFSHYEIYVSNLPPGFAGYGHQNIPVKEIYDQEVTRFIDKNPPYFSKPVYTIRAHNVFGGVSEIVSDEVTSGWEVDFKRKEVLDFKSINSIAIDPAQPIAYFLGIKEGTYQLKISAYNYTTKTTQAESTGEYQGGASIKLVNSEANGMEIVSCNSNELVVYNAENLDYKYLLTLDSPSSIEDFQYLGNQLWALVDHADLHIYKRDNGNFFLVEKMRHFENPQSYTGYKIAALGDGQLLVGHFEESESLLFRLDGTGHFKGVAETVQIPLYGDYTSDVIYNKPAGYILNAKQNKLYGTTDFKFLTSFEAPYFPTAVSTDGTMIFGTNNDPEWNISDESLHRKAAVTWNKTTGTVQNFETMGYPLFVFENPDGKIVSISSGLKRSSLNDTEERASFFLEDVKAD